MDINDYLQRHYSSSSIKSYRNMIGRYEALLGERAKSAGYRDVLDYIGILRKGGLHPRSLRNHLFAIKIYYNYLIEAGQREEHPCRWMNLRDKINRQIEIESLYNRKELEEFYESYRARAALLENRDRIIIGLLIYQALTVMEIGALRMEDINLEKGRIRIGESRNTKGRSLTLKPEQIMLFYRYLQEDRELLSARGEGESDRFLLSEKGGGLVIHNIGRVINRGRKKKLLPQKIRQSVIAELLKENHDLRIVQEFAGHRRSSCTQSYRQSGLEELRAMILRHHPLK
jgi:site-specific recombinase XerD